MFPDLRRQCAEQLLDLDADGYAIGGLSVGRAAGAQPGNGGNLDAPLLPRDRPRYVMGVGMPEELPEYVARGVDMMDCVLPSRNARNGYLFTSEGRVIIKQTQYKEDPRPLDAVLPVLYLPELLAGLSAAPVSGGGDDVFDPGHPAQPAAVP